MRDVVEYRGPDDRGSYVDGSVGLGHRRLSIIDLGGGHQPMASRNGRFVVAYNGEIYNFLELRRALEQHGLHFDTSSDTEVLLRAHEHWGDDAATRLNGIFAYALWDRREQRLLLVRDRLGIKPLHFAQSSRGIAFGSEPKSLFASGIVDAALDDTAVFEYLTFRSIAGSKTLYRGVESVPPGAIVEVRGGRVASTRSYWTPPVEPLPRTDYASAVDELDGLLNAAIRRQMVSDVPLGTFCSGGIDSSLVTAIAARHASGTLNTFSVGFDDPAFDERAHARVASRLAGGVHHEIVVSEREFVDLLPRLAWHHDAPLHFANSVHIYAVSMLARRFVTVVLTGEGADELFGGYPRYYLARISALGSRLPKAVKLAVSSVLARSKGHRAIKAARALTQTVEEAVLFNNAVVDPERMEAICGGRMVHDLTHRRELRDAALSVSSDAVAATMRVDASTYLAALLDRQDRMSMAASIESRVPFLDNDVVDFAMRLPTPFKQSRKSRKRILCDVASRYLPDSIVHRSKSGFGVPLASWLRDGGPMANFVEEALDSSMLRDLELCGAGRSAFERHRAGTEDASEFLWSLASLSCWAAVGLRRAAVDHSIYDVAG